MQRAPNTPLIATKLFMPPPRDDLVARPRLIERLNSRAGCRLILVTAPAGFGKTTLVTSWLAQQDRPVAWVSLDDNDNNPLMFFAYLFEALQHIQAGLCTSSQQLIHSADPPAPQVILAYLINDLYCLTQGCILVLDDYHVIHSPEVDAALEFLIARAPDILQIVITSRHAPKFPVSALRVKNLMAEINAFDLRFSRDEAESLLNNIMKLDLTPEQVDELERRTEGWVAGLQLAAIGIRERQRSPEYAYDLSGDDRLIADYLVDEVIAQQPETIQRFLLQTSILNRFSPSLCSAVLDIDDAQSTLFQLERANLFLIPLDNRREWYRYHHLFSDLLRRRLVERWPERLPVLYQKTVDWHAENGLVKEAIEYAIEGEYYERAIQLLEPIIHRLQDSAQRTLIIKWLDRIPKPLWRKRILLWTHYIIAQFYFGNFNEAHQTLHDLWDTSLPLPDMSDAELCIAQAHKSTLLGAITIHTTLDAARVQELTGEGLDCLADDFKLMRGIAYGHFGAASLLLGELDTADEMLTRALDLLTDFAVVTLVFLSYLSELAIARGKLHLALRRLRQAQQHAQTHGLHEGNTFATTLIHLGLLHYEWNDLKKAEELIHKGIHLVESGASIDRILESYQALIRLNRRCPGLAAIDEKFNHAERVAAEYSHPPLVLDRIGALRAEAALNCGDLKTAACWEYDFVQKRGPSISLLQRYEWLTAARVELAVGRVQQGIEHLLSLQTLCSKAGLFYDLLAVKVALAGAYSQVAETDRAIEALREALAIAEPEGYIRVFVDAGTPIWDLLVQVRESIDKHGKQVMDPPRPVVSAWYVEEIAAVFLEDRAGEVDALTGADSTLNMPTPRERDVLVLLAEGLSYADITRQLNISENTLKSHIKNLYNKLDVHNRMQAVLKAQELGLL